VVPENWGKKKLNIFITEKAMQKTIGFGVAHFQTIPFDL
jgi:hypothetical protein